MCIFIYKREVYIDGSRAVYRISLSTVGPQVNRERLIEEVSVKAVIIQSIFYVKLMGLPGVF